MLGKKTVLFHLLFLVFIFSCASPQPSKRETISSSPLPPEPQYSRQVKAMNERILMGVLSTRKDPRQDYRIGPEDLLEVSVFEDEKLNKMVRVSSQGNITLPLLGTLRVKGLAASELEKEIRELLTEKYLQNPNVSVFIKEYRNQRIAVMGAVEKPGVFDITGQRSVLDMLGMAGGLKEDAGQMLFLIRSPGPAEKGSKEAGGVLPETMVIDLEELLIRGDLTLNLPVNHGDVLNIPVSGKIFVGGEVFKPGGFLLKGKRMTINQAIAMAEGLKTTADGTRSTVFRYSGRDGQRELIPVDIYAVQKGQAEDISLKENDIIIVPKSGLKTFLIEFRDTVKGIFGLGFSLGTL
jgi:polysaccharide export outer membrane protein